MTTEKQIAANRQNAKKSTGPRTREGKLNSRRNAFRHGLTAETVITLFEDAGEYAAFENSIIADYEPQTAVERALAARLASLLWRLRRATTIESGLLQMHDQCIDDSQQNPATDSLNPFKTLLLQNGENQRNSLSPSALLDAAHCFIHLNEKNRHILDHISRYELGLWRQVAQTLLILGNTHHTRPRFWSLPRSWLTREGRY